MRQLLIATQNKGKIQEIEDLLSDIVVQLVTPDQIGLKLNVKEDGGSYTENATKKGLAYGDAANLLTLADDSGLEVDYLDGQPGLFSARFSSKPQATDADRRSFLLEKLKHFPQPWSAQFRCVIALYDPMTGVYHSEGVCPGKIISEERGHNGFGYDPIFLVDGLERTMAELSMDEKNKISHRAGAILLIKPKIMEILNF
jgi:XTP/dITP diphosphohydrolase